MTQHDSAESCPETSARAQDVLQLFGALRSDILEIVRHAEAMCAEAGRAGELARSHLTQALGAVGEARLNLVVVGGEGQGKSTLINALLGQELTPVSEVEPGTVAPVFIQHGPSPGSEFEVQLEGETKPRCMAGQREFDEYLLQANNEKNKKGVVSGTIRVAHELLANGLKIVDMPGTEGASPAIHEMAQRFIKEQAHAVIGVLRRAGGYGSFSRIRKDMLPPDRDPQAIVYNSDNENWKRKTEAERHEFVTKQRGVVIKKLQEGSPDLCISEDHIFVLHLPTFRALQLRHVDEVEVDSAMHEAEVARFQSFVWAYMRDNGVGEVIREAQQAAEDAIHELQDWLGWRKQVLDTIEQGGEAYDSLRADLAEGLRAARDHWDSRAWQEAVDALAAKAWSTVKGAIVAHREALQDIVHELRGQLERSEGRLSRDQAVTLRSGLDQQLRTCQEQLAGVQSTELEGFAQIFIGHANQALGLVNDRVPVLRETVGKILITPEEVIRVQLGSIDPGLLHRVGQIVAVGGSGLGLAAACGAIPGFAGMFAAGNLALLLPFMNPVTGWFVGLAAGAAIGYGLYRQLRDPHREGLRRALDQLQQDIVKSDTTDQGEPRQRWEKSARAIVQAIAATLEKRLAGIENVFAAPTQNRSRLAGERQEVEALLAELSGMERALLRIVQRAPRRAIS
jgi:hypothetical protein